MLHTFVKHRKEHPFIVLLILMLFFSSQVALTIYIDSSYLTQTIESSSFFSGGIPWSNPENIIGIIYALAQLLAVVAFMTVPTVLKRVGNYHATLSALIFQIVMLLGLGLSNSPLFIIPTFIGASVMTAILYFNFDIFLERYSKNKDTGKIRGLFLMLSSIVWVIAAKFSGTISELWGYQMVYLIGAFLLIPMVFIMMHFFNHFKDLEYKDGTLLMTREEIKHNKDISNILVVNFFLHFFYAWMIIYAPLYLLHTIGFTEGDIGTILAIALTAFIIFPYPAGLIADRYLGEKELLITGFLIMAGTSIMIPFLGMQPLSLWIWALILFIGRVGASVVEIMTETYFFKQIDGGNAGLISYFRRSRPIAFIAAPILASLLLMTNVVTIGGLFFLLGAFMILALRFVIVLKDTK